MADLGYLPKREWYVSYHQRYLLEGKKTRDFVIKIPSKNGVYKVEVKDYIERFLYIRPKPKNFMGEMGLVSSESEDSALVLFKLNPQQIRLYNDIKFRYEHYLPMRYLILKARQIGFSTLIAAIIFTLTIYSPYRESLVISDKDDHTSRIFEMYQRFYDNLPLALKPKLNANKRGTILSTSYESTIQVETVSDDLARGSTLLAAHLSEYAMWRKQQEALASLNSAVAFSPDTFLFVETTAKGMNFFRSLYIDALEKQNNEVSFFDTNLIAWFESWYLNKDYRSPCGFNKEFYKEELIRQGEYDDELTLYEEYKEHGMSLENIMWRRTQIDTMGLDMFRQENPTYPDEAFLSTGVSVFNQTLVSKRLKELGALPPYSRKANIEYKESWNTSGNRVVISDIKIINDPLGDLTIYEEPIPGYPYVIGADPAGVNGKDYFCAQVIRHDGNIRKQVAVYRRQKLDPDTFGSILYALGTFYNTALIGVETNTGQNANKRLAMANYRKIYVRQNLESYDENVVSSYGISTQASNKEDMITNLKARFREFPYEFIDRTTLNEMATYVVLDIGTRGNYIMGAATPSDHDDTVMAYAIALTIGLTNQQRTAIDRSKEMEKEIPLPFRSNRNTTKGEDKRWKNITIR